MQNRGLAFIKTLHFYGRSKPYLDLHGSTPIQDLMSFHDTIGTTIKQEPILSEEGGDLLKRICDALIKALPHWHQGMQWQYQEELK